MKRPYARSYACSAGPVAFWMPGGASQFQHAATFGLMVLLLEDLAELLRLAAAEAGPCLADDGEYVARECELFDGHAGPHRYEHLWNAP